MDFVHDQLATGRKIRILTVIDTFSRFSPATDPRFSYRGEDVVLALESICHQVGYPQSIRVDQGSEFISRDLAYQKASSWMMQAWQAHRQCLHRVLQRQVPGRMPERTLVHEP